VNGHTKEAAAFARVMGYCEQSDVHSSGATVEESVRTSGTLRLGSDVTREQARFLCSVAMSDYTRAVHKLHLM
jgi:ABC-type multidrug transport system ATPase subunit